MGKKYRLTIAGKSGGETDPGAGRSLFGSQCFACAVKPSPRLGRIGFELQRRSIQLNRAFQLALLGERRGEVDSRVRVIRIGIHRVLIRVDRAGEIALIAERMS